MSAPGHRLRTGERLTLTCVGVDDDGAGICRALVASEAAHTSDTTVAAAPSEVHVRGALPGETVAAIVSHASPHGPQAWGDLQSIETATATRRTPVCPAFGPCGGCVLQHWDLDAQRAWKAERVRAALSAHPALARIAVDDCVPSPLALGYRNNAKLVCARDPDGALILGAFAPRSHAVVDLRGCRIVEPALDVAAAALRDALAAAGAVPYDERLLTGDVRYAVLRANHRGQVLVTLVTARAVWPLGAIVAADLLARCPAVAGVVQNVNPTRGNVILGDQETTLAGAGTLDEQIGPARLRLSSRAFFQANRAVAALAYDRIVGAVSGAGTPDAKPIECLVDAYCGVGGIALTAAAHARAIVGIENNPVAIADATAAANDAGITHARFVVADTAAGLGALARADAIVLNPPRKGCAPAVLNEVLRLRPRIVAYLSCAPETLARDLASLVGPGAGYRVDSLTPYDMLPHTPHVESLAIVSSPPGET